MKKKIRIVVLLAVIASALAWALFFRNGQDPNAVRLSGNIEVTQVDLAFELPGILKERLVDEGEKVAKGQVVARLDGVNYRLQVQQAEANLAYAQAVLSELEAGSRTEEVQQAEAQVKQQRSMLQELVAGSRTQEIQEAKANVEQAQAARAAADSRCMLAKADFDRYSAVFHEGGVSRQAFETYESQWVMAQNALEESAARLQAARERLKMVEEGPRKEHIQKARAALAQAEAAYELVKAGPRAESIAQARAKAAAAEEALRMARQKLDDTEILSPLDGVVLSKSAEPGAYMNPGMPVVTVAQMDPVWLRAFVGETNLGRVRLGMELNVTADTYPGKVYHGRISFIGHEAEFTPKMVQTYEERVSLMYRVKIELENPSGELKPGMPADAILRVSP